MNPTFEIIFLFFILIFGIVGTTFIGYVFYKYETTTEMIWMDAMFIVSICSFIPIGALVFSTLMLLQKL